MFCHKTVYKFHLFKSWAEPLGKALAVSSTIVDGLGHFVPGVGVIGGALSFGATLLNPQPSLKDLQKQLIDIQATLVDGALSKTIMMVLQKEKKEIQDRMDNPVGEIRDNYEEVISDVKEVYKKVGEFNTFLSGDMAKMKDKLNQAFNVVTETRYKVTFNNTFKKIL